MGFTHISEDSSEIAFLLVENYNVRFLPGCASTGVVFVVFRNTDFPCSMTTLIGLRSDRESLETISLMRLNFFIAGGPSWTAVKKNCAVDFRCYFL